MRLARNWFAKFVGTTLTSVRLDSPDFAALPEIPPEAKGVEIIEICCLRDEQDQLIGDVGATRRVIRYMFGSEVQTYAQLYDRQIKPFSEFMHRSGGTYVFNRTNGEWIPLEDGDVVIYSQKLPAKQEAA